MPAVAAIAVFPHLRLPALSWTAPAVMTLPFIVFLCFPLTDVFEPISYSGGTVSIFVSTKELDEIFFKNSTIYAWHFRKNKVYYIWNNCSPPANVISLSRREITVGEYIRLSPQTWGWPEKGSHSNLHGTFFPHTRGACSFFWVSYSFPHARGGDPKRVAVAICMALSFPTSVGRDPFLRMLFFSPHSWGWSEKGRHNNEQR